MVRFLLDRGADPKKTDAKGHTPLMSAAQIGDGTLIRLFLDQGADIDAYDSREWTPLMHAAFHGRFDAADILLDQGADPNLISESGQSPLTLAKDYLTKARKRRGGEDVTQAEALIALLREAGAEEE